MLLEEIYDLVTIKQYNGIRNNCHVWIPLGYAVVIKRGDNKAVCLRDENVEYEYLPISNEERTYDYSNIEIGTIRIFSYHNPIYDNMLVKTRLRLNVFIETYKSSFTLDTKYGRIIDEEKTKKMIIKK